MKYSACAECEIISLRKLWNIAPVGRNVKWNLPTFALANISHLRSKYFTAKLFHLPKGQISLKKDHRVGGQKRIGVFAFGEDTLSLRLKSELPDGFRSNANPAPAAPWWESTIPLPERKKAPLLRCFVLYRGYEKDIFWELPLGFELPRKLIKSDPLRLSQILS